MHKRKLTWTNLISYSSSLEDFGFGLLSSDSASSNSFVLYNLGDTSEMRELYIISSLTMKFKGEGSI